MTKCAVIQMVSGLSVEKNLETAARLMRKAVEQNAELVALPENFAVMLRQETSPMTISESSPRGPIQNFLSEQAKENQVWILGGTIPLQAKSPDKIRAASLLYDDKGQLVTRYDKIHLFDVSVSSTESYLESRTVEPGEQIIVVDTPIGRMGLSVCYDLRFPELYREFTDKGAEIFAVPSAFTRITGEAHWEVLLRARAIENLSYVIAPNQAGHHENGRTTYGHSMIIDPWGKILGCCTSDEGIVVADIDLNALRERRKNFPVLEHRK
ncbi:MAG: carbon-nitrogen hydrolase family protein [Proteobacteria bacterium]|nr:carbon-nitrogen hydrolase family protein [Pseudomonadota bacterium]